MGGRGRAFEISSRQLLLAVEAPETMNWFLCISLAARVCAFVPARGQEPACEKVTFVKKQPVAVVCDGFTTKSATFS